MRVHYGEGVAIHIGPEPCAVTREGWRRSVGRGAHRPARVSFFRKATWTGAPPRAPARPGVVGDPGMCGSALHGNREISGLTGGWTPLFRVGKARSRNRRCTDPRSLTLS